MRETRRAAGFAMANNYSQPYYGMPFQYPPPQMNQQQPPYAHMDPQSGFQDMSQPPTPSAFQHIPGLHHPLAPTSQATNNHSYSQNTQQPPLPPGVPGENSRKSTCSESALIVTQPIGLPIPTPSLRSCRCRMPSLTHTLLLHPFRASRSLHLRRPILIPLNCLRPQPHSPLSPCNHWPQPAVAFKR